MSDAKRIEDLPVMTELGGPEWAGDFEWVQDDLFKREYQGLLASPWGDGVVAYRNEDIFALQRHSGTTHQTLEASVAGLTPPGSPADRGLSGFMAVNSFAFRPPEHAPFKKLTAERIAPNSLAEYRTMVGDAAAESIARVVDNGAVDAYQDIANPLVAAVWGNLIGVTTEEAMRLMALGLDLALLNELDLTEAHITKCNASADEYMDLFTSSLRRSAESGDYPLLNALVEAHATMGEVGRPTEPFGAFASALADGFATLPVVVGTLMWSYATYGLTPQGDDLDEWATSAFLEIARIHSPILGTVRSASEDFEYGGVRIPEGSNIWMLWVFGDRDPEAFPEPLSFNLDRPRRKTVAFGGGNYACSGQTIAKLVSSEFIKAIARSGASLRVEGTPEWTRGTLIHGLENLQVSFTRS